MHRDKGSKLGIISKRTNRPLRPDVQIELGGGNFGVVDFTSRGSAGKAYRKYKHARSPDIYEVLYRLPKGIR